jgi:EAL domain-containing protein (putative c-di-GMP-specific phosphodiesterase class I)
VTKSTNRKCKELNSKTIGEWIETEQKRKLLEECGIDYGQGYYFGEPVVFEKVSKEDFYVRQYN